MLPDDRVAAHVPVEGDLDVRKLTIAAVLCGVGFLAIAALVATGTTAAVDEWWHESLAHLRSSPLVWVAQALTVVGDVPITTAFRVAGAGWLLWRRTYASFWAWAIAASLSPLLVEVCKHVIGRARPAEFVWTAGGFSFPSGHAAAAATNAALVALLLVPARYRRAAWIAGAVWTVAMALARTLLGAHWLSDVAGGILLGLSVPFGAVAAVFAPRARNREEEDGTWDARSP